METTPTKSTEVATINTKKEVLKKSSVLVAMFAILIGLIVATVILVPKGLSTVATISLSSIFTPKEKIKVVTEKSAVLSGDMINLSWNGATHSDGSYTITYPCKDGIEVFFHTGDIMTCDTAFYFTSLDNTASFKINSSRNIDTDVPFYINYKDIQGKTTLIGDILITVKTSKPTSPKPATSTTPAVTVTPTPVKTPPKPVTSNPKPEVKSANLTVQLVARGSLSASNIFTPGFEVKQGERQAVRFSVSNTGNTTTGNWTFKAVTPSPTIPVYQSNLQGALRAGEKVEFTLGFDNSPTGGQVTISVNEDKLVTESSYADNVLTYKVQGTNSSSVTTTQGKDLSIRITSVGYMDANGTYVASNNISTSTRAAFKFVVTNIGKDASGAFIWNATLPSTTDKTYTSVAQQSLNSGDSIEYTLAFNNIAAKGNNTITVNVDSDNTVIESNEANNTTSTVFVAY